MKFAQAYKQNLMKESVKSPDPGAAIDLYLLMSSISRGAWKTAWVKGCEELFWAWAHDPTGTAIDPDERLALQELSEKAGGWWAWGETSYPTFMETSIWEAYLWN